MRILSKYKDYYDYLAGIYGMDNKLVLDRRKGNTPDWYNFTDNSTTSLIINDKEYTGYIHNYKLYTGNELLKVGFKEEKNEYTSSCPSGWHNGNYWEKFIRIPKEPKTTDINTKRNIGIIMGEYDYPKLEKFGWQKLIPPHIIWLELSEWLGKQLTAKEPVVPVGNDKTRILNAGFDLKTSFRHIKNKY